MTGGGRLFRKYVLWTMALVCGALLASGAISIYFSYLENKSALSLVQHEKAVAAAARIEQFIRQIEQQLVFKRASHQLNSHRQAAAGNRDRYGHRGQPKYVGHQRGHRRPEEPDLLALDLPLAFAMPEGRDAEHRHQDRRNVLHLPQQRRAHPVACR